MEIKYVYDAQGNETAVIVPIEVWNKIKHIDDKKSIEVFQPSKYRGIYKNLELDLEKEIKNLRTEWLRTMNYLTDTIYINLLLSQFNTLRKNWKKSISSL